MQHSISLYLLEIGFSHTACTFIERICAICRTSWTMKGKWSMSRRECEELWWRQQKSIYFNQIHENSAAIGLLWMSYYLGHAYIQKQFYRLNRIDCLKLTIPSIPQNILPLQQQQQQATTTTTTVITTKRFSGDIDSETKINSCDIDFHRVAIHRNQIYVCRAVLIVTWAEAKELSMMK